MARSLNGTIWLAGYSKNEEQTWWSLLSPVEQNKKTNKKTNTVSSKDVEKFAYEPSNTHY